MTETSIYYINFSDLPQERVIDTKAVMKLREQGCEVVIPKSQFEQLMKEVGGRYYEGYGYRILVSREGWYSWREDLISIKKRFNLQNLTCLRVGKELDIELLELKEDSVKTYQCTALELTCGQPKMGGTGPIEVTRVSCPT